MTKEITLSNGMGTLVDDEDYAYLSQFKWWANKVSRNCIYAAHTEYTKCGNSRLYMHRAIMLPTSDQLVDHRNHDTLDNRRENLRVCSKGQNQFNLSIMSFHKSSKFKGVSWYRRDSIWTAYINKNGRRIYLGRFPTEEAAAQAYDAAAVYHFGEFANLNFQVST